MKWFYGLSIIYKVMLPVSLALVVVLSVLDWQIHSKGAEIIQNVAERELIALSGKYSAEVHGFINQALNGAINTSAIIASFDESSTSLPLSRAQKIELLAQNLASGQVNSTAILMLPTPEDVHYANAPGSTTDGQFIPHVTLGGVGVLDKAELNADYFTMPQGTKKPYISDPFFFMVDGKKTFMSSLTAPIIVNNVFKGITAIDFELNVLRDMTEKISIYDTGGVTVLSATGVIIAHADPELTLVNMFDLDRWKNNTDLKKAITRGQPYLGFATSNGVENIYYFQPIVFPQTGQAMYFVANVPINEILTDVEQLTNITLIASIFALVSLLIVIFFGVRSAIKPLDILAAASEEVAKGNFAVKIDARTFGREVLNLKYSLDTMLVSLVENINKSKALSEDAQAQTLKAQEAMSEAEAAKIAAEGAKREGMLAAAHQLEDVVSIVSTASQQLSLKIEQSEYASSRQAERMAETATAMEEMNSTVLEVAQSAGTANEMSSQARTQAELGTRIVQESVSGITGVQEVSLALKEDMNVLSAKAMAISEIMNVISDIADQTNLLALNAAIEAARAGEAGRGFAVVADEVRKLAEKTMSSTTDVGNAIQSIQASVNTSINQVDKAVELISGATEKSNQSGTSLKEIAVLVDTVADQVRSIATASEEQSATSEEINKAISEINELAEQSAKGMREATVDVSELTTQAQALSKLIDEMKHS